MGSSSEVFVQRFEYINRRAGRPCLPLLKQFIGPCYGRPSAADSGRESDRRFACSGHNANTFMDSPQPAAQAEVVQRYTSGEPSTALADHFKVAKSTILRILRENSVVVRRQPLTSKQVATAKRLYESGLSLSAVAEQMSVNQETMRVAIINAGVRLRAPTRQA